MAEPTVLGDFGEIVGTIIEGKPPLIVGGHAVNAWAMFFLPRITAELIKFQPFTSKDLDLLGVTRRTLTAWQKMDGAPKPLSNGMWSVADWREFVRLHGLKGIRTAPHNEEALKARKLLAEVEEREIKVAIKKGDYIRVEEVRSEWIGLVAQATAILRAKFENELPPVLSGLDATGIQAECRKAIDEVLRALHGS